MARAKGIVAVILAVTIASVLITPMADVVSSSTGTQSVTNETITAQTGEYVDLQGYEIDGTTETVYGLNETSGSYETASEGTDYELATENGSIKALNGSTLIDDGENVKVSYDYQATSGTTTMIAGYLVLFVVLLILVVLSSKLQEML